MKNNVFIRKIDSMGRIVIPKDLRKELKINDDDNLELSLVDEHIEITRCSYMNIMKKIVNFIELTKYLIDGRISVFENNSNMLPESIIEVINKRKEYYSSFIETYSINCETLRGYFGFVPLISEGELIGLFVIQKEEPFADLDRLYIHLIKCFVENINYL